MFEIYAAKPINMEIKYGVVGLILKGDDQAKYVKIEDDTSGSTGGIYILISEDEFFTKNVFDDWLPNKDDILEYVEESRWEIQWR